MNLEENPGMGTAALANTLTKAIGNEMVRSASVSLRSSVVAHLCRSELMVGEIRPGLINIHGDKSALH